MRCAAVFWGRCYESGGGPAFWRPSAATTVARRREPIEDACTIAEQTACRRTLAKVLTKAHWAL